MRERMFYIALNPLLCYIGTATPNPFRLTLGRCEPTLATSSLTKDYDPVHLPSLNLGIYHGKIEGMRFEWMQTELDAPIATYVQGKHL